MTTTLAWKDNWEETRQHFVDWWNHEGLVVCGGPTPPADPAHEDAEDPGWHGGDYGDRDYCSSPGLRSRVTHFNLSRRTFPLDNLPLASTDIGPGSFAIYMGCEPGFGSGTVWCPPWMTDPDPSGYPPLRFVPSGQWWQITEETLRQCAALGRGKYLVGCPDLIENVDSLASLRGTQALFLDLTDRPEWVKEKLRELNREWFDVYERVHDHIALEDGSSAFGAFGLWGPGKTAKVQCDACAMLSPATFREFVAPALAEQCEWLDHSMFHLDGGDCICHLDALLEIEALDAIEWTPSPGLAPGGDPAWHDMYRRILSAGKSVQAIGVDVSQLEALLDAVGPRGMYVSVGGRDEKDLACITKIAESYR